MGEKEKPLKPDPKPDPPDDPPDDPAKPAPSGKPAWVAKLENDVAELRSENASLKSDLEAIAHGQSGILDSIGKLGGSGDSKEKPPPEKGKPPAPERRLRLFPFPRWE